MPLHILAVRAGVHGAIGAYWLWFWVWVAIICVAVPLPGCLRSGCCAYEYRGKRSPPEAPEGYVWTQMDECLVLLKETDLEATVKVKGEVVTPKK